MARQYLLTETEVTIAQDCLVLTDRDGGGLSTKLATVLSSFDTEALGEADAETRGIGLTDDEARDLLHAAQDHLLRDTPHRPLDPAERSLLQKLES